MSEPIGMTIEIGGNLSADKISDFIDLVKDNISDLQDGDPTESDLRAISGKETLRYTGVSNYGLCNDLMTFLKKNKIGYIHRSDAKYEYDGMINYWIPGMKKEMCIRCTSEGSPTVDIHLIKPFCDLLITMLGQSDPGKVLPAFIDSKDEDIKDIVEQGLKNHKKIPEILKQKLEELCPSLPFLPAFRIV